jgi:hypothetical protein
MKTFEAIGKRCSLKAHLSRRAVKLPGAKRLGFREDSPSGSFLREEASASFARAGAAAPKSPALPFTPTAMRLPTAKRLDVLWLFPIDQGAISSAISAISKKPVSRCSAVEDSPVTKLSLTVSTERASTLNLAASV